MLHNIVQKNKIPIPQEQPETASDQFEQPQRQVISCSNIVSRSDGEKRRNMLIKITNKQPLRKQIVLKKK